MKRMTSMMLGLALLSAALPVLAQTNAAPDYSKMFKDDKEKDSYAVGVFFGNNIKGLVSAESNSVDVHVIEKALSDTVHGVEPKLTPQEVRDIITAFQMRIRTEQAEKQRAIVRGIIETNSRIGAEFLAKNKNQPGVITLTNGMQYKVFTAGTGEKPKLTDTVTVTYRGTQIDGTEFDSSAKSGIHEFQVTHVIKGWTEALQIMPVGSKWQLFIPPDLAYGDRGAPPSIMPGQTLIFEVELQGAKPTPPPATPTAQMTSDIIKVPSAEGLKHGEKIETIKASDVEKMGTNAAK